jgi:hypothetical protein
MARKKQPVEPPTSPLTVADSLKAAAILEAADQHNARQGIEVPKQAYDYEIHLQRASDGGYGGVRICSGVRDGEKRVVSSVRDGNKKVVPCMADHTHPAMCQGCLRERAAEKLKNPAQQFHGMLVR